MKGLIRDVFGALFKIKVDDLKGWEDTHLTDTMCERIKECLPEGIDVRHTHISGSSLLLRSKCVLFHPVANRFFVKND